MKMYFYKMNEIVKPMFMPALIPANEPDLESLKQFKHGSYITADVKSLRNPDFHRKFMKMIRGVKENSDYPTVEMLIHDLKLWLGHYRLIVTPAGNPIYDPKSINFEKMDNLQFERFFSHSIDALMKYVIGEINDRVERDRLVEMLLGFA